MLTHMHTHTHSFPLPPHTLTLPLHTPPPPALTSSPPLTLGFEQSAYTVSEDDHPFSVCVRVMKCQLEDQITITIDNNDTEAIGMFLKSTKSVYFSVQKFVSILSIMV